MNFAGTSDKKNNRKQLFVLINKQKPSRTNKDDWNCLEALASSPYNQMSGGVVASACTSSLNRNHEWKRCCADAMGFEWVDRFDDESGTKGDENDFDSGEDAVFQLTNLLDDDDDFVEDPDPFDYRDEQAATGLRRRKQSSDAWEENALRIQADLNRMSQWIQSKKQEYVGLDMKDEEVALIQSTVTSFAATTAGELETLRNMIQSSSQRSTVPININLSNHRAGIVQILLGQLQEHVTRPFGVLQKQRVRVAVQLWQNPLQCKLYDAPKRISKESIFDEEDEDAHEQKDQRFLPIRSYQESTNTNGHGDFISKYANKRITSVPSEPPAFLVNLSKHGMIKKTEEQDSEASSIPSKTNTTEEESFDDFPSLGFQKPSPQLQSRPRERQENQADMYHQQLEEDLRTESVQLATTLIASNDLDSVQQMETRMVEITTLIGQFSNLVQEQQEQIVQVHESAKETKDNLDKGQENLIDAAERTRQSRHYKAWSILAMSAILMFFQILRN